MTLSADLRPLLAEGALLGRVPEELDERIAELLGRAAGTLARRRGMLRATFALSLEPGRAELLPLRDGLVRGLLQSGHDVTDLGDCDADSYARALERLAPPADARLLAVDERCGLSLRLDGRVLSAADLDELCAIAAAGDFSSGCGALRVTMAAEAARDEG